MKTNLLRWRTVSGGFILLYGLLLLQAVPSHGAAPVINSFNPTAAPVGATVTIRGANFSSTPTNNIVYFRTVTATVVSASATQLVVTVPVCAAYGPISVTTGGLSGYSRLRFTPTFVSERVINAASFGARIDLGITYPGWSGSGQVADIDGDGKPELITTANH